MHVLISDIWNFHWKFNTFLGKVKCRNVQYKSIYESSIMIKGQMKIWKIMSSSHIKIHVHVPWDHSVFYRIMLIFVSPQIKYMYWINWRYWKISVTSLRLLQTYMYILNSVSFNWERYLSISILLVEKRNLI